MIGPWHLPELFDLAIDRRQPQRNWRRWPYRHGRRRDVHVWHTRTPGGALVVWPPIDPADQPEYARRLVAARLRGDALVTVIRRGPATVCLVVDVFGPELTGDEQRRLGWVFRSLTPPKVYGKIPRWGASRAGPHGGFITHAAVWRDDGYDWRPTDRLAPALEELERILALDQPTRAAA